MFRNGLLLCSYYPELDSSNRAIFIVKIYILVIAKIYQDAKDIIREPYYLEVG